MKTFIFKIIILNNMDNTLARDHTYNGGSADHNESSANNPHESDFSNLISFC